MNRTERTRPGALHRETAREAGLGRFSPLSIVAGTMCAYGTFAIVAAVVGALLTRADVDTEFRSDDWTGSGAVAALAAAAVLLLAYLFGGYVAGRMARRSGLLHGLGVFLLSLVAGGLIGWVASLAEGADVQGNLRSIGVPTTWDQVENVALAGAIVSLAAILVGSLLGGALGERWHTRLARRVADPDVGPAADARLQAERQEELRREHVADDAVMRRETHAGAVADAHRGDGDRRATARDEVDLRDQPPPPPPGTPVDEGYAGRSR